ncbi:MAG TPA: YdcF family protein [Gammaproteobacteria bacterium]|nr:YdcF family protein [Gammaproteobacteria bacterium]
MKSRVIDGYLMLLFSIALIALSAGLSFLTAFIYTCYIAVKTSGKTINTEQIIILGKKLIHNQPDNDYLARLNRAIRIAEHTTDIHILGGYTGGSTISESESGKNYLQKKKIRAGHIYTEEMSRDTLDNLKQLKNSKLIKGTAITLITSRYHLARAGLMAQGFDFTVVPCAAEDAYTPGILASLTLVSEAFFLHWYLSGRIFAQLTRNQRMLTRIK